MQANNYLPIKKVERRKSSRHSVWSRLWSFGMVKMSQGYAEKELEEVLSWISTKFVKWQWQLIQVWLLRETTKFSCKKLSKIFWLTLERVSIKALKSIRMNFKRSLKRLMSATSTLLPSLSYCVRMLKLNKFQSSSRSKFSKKEMNSSMYGCTKLTSRSNQSLNHSERDSSFKVLSNKWRSSNIKEPRISSRESFTYTCSPTSMITFNSTCLINSSAKKLPDPF